MEKDRNYNDLLIVLKQIAEALERLVPESLDIDLTDEMKAYTWDPNKNYLNPAEGLDHIPLQLLKGVDRVKNTLLENTSRFAKGLPANNALLWGARGMGKSSLVKSIHNELCVVHPDLVLIEILKEDISSLKTLIPKLKTFHRKFILFCDDLSFESGDVLYKSLKVVLEGGIIGRPENVLFYATSNRRHLMKRNLANESQNSLINPADEIEEQVSLSDRFGLWLGFHNCEQTTYLDIIEGYAEWFEINSDTEDLHAAALAWSVSRGARNGRVAWQFIQSLAEKTHTTLLKS